MNEAKGPFLISWDIETLWDKTLNVFNKYWDISEIQFKYEKLKFYDLLNGSMELVFQIIQKWDI